MCSLDVAFASATIRNRSREYRMAVPMGNFTEVVLFGSFRCLAASFRVAGMALRDIQTCSATCHNVVLWGRCNTFATFAQDALAFFVAGAALWTRPSSFFVAGATL